MILSGFCLWLKFDQFCFKSKQIASQDVLGLDLMVSGRGSLVSPRHALRRARESSVTNELRNFSILSPFAEARGWSWVYPQSTTKGVADAGGSVGGWGGKLKKAKKCTGGTWCSGRAPAQHARGPGFNPQCVHFVFFAVFACG